MSPTVLLIVLSIISLFINAFLSTGIVSRSKIYPVLYYPFHSTVARLFWFATLTIAVVFLINDYLFDIPGVLYGYSIITVFLWFGIINFTSVYYKLTSKHQ